MDRPVTPTRSSPAAARAAWRDVVAPYQQPSLRRSVTQLSVTLLALSGAFVAMYFSLRLSYLLTLTLSVVAAGFLIRTFIIMHDCGHGSFFRSRRANNLVGFVTGALTLTPYAQWAKDHAIHHATSGHLDKRGYGDIETLTVDEYLALGRLGRLKYRFYRNPAVLLGLGPLWLVIKQRVHTPKSAGRRELLGVHLTNATVLLALTAASLLVGPRAVAAIYAPTVIIAAAAGIWLFYVQHQYERTLLGLGRGLGLRHRRRRGQLLLPPAARARVADGEHRLPPRPSPQPPHPELLPPAGARGESLLPPRAPDDAAGERARVLPQAVGRGPRPHDRVGRAREAAGLGSPRPCPARPTCPPARRRGRTSAPTRKGRSPVPRASCAQHRRRPR